MECFNEKEQLWEEVDVQTGTVCQTCLTRDSGIHETYSDYPFLTVFRAKEIRYSSARPTQACLNRV